MTYSDRDGILCAVMLLIRKNIAIISKKRKSDESTRRSRIWHISQITPSYRLRLLGDVYDEHKFRDVLHRRTRNTTSYSTRGKPGEELLFD
jgi:hypothetical protein